MNFFKRLFKAGQAEAHAVMDKLENPIKMTEQGIRDLKKDLDVALKSLAEVKAMGIRAKNDVENAKSAAQNWENKAMLLLKKAQTGEMEMIEAERLAAEALTRKEENLQTAATAKKNQDQFEKSVADLEKKVKVLKSNIAKFENELKTLKARQKVAKATKSINKQMADIDSSSTISMLERMKDKVAEEEALAESYGEIANENKSIDEDIDKALEGVSSAAASDELAKLKAKLGMDK